MRKAISVQIDDGKLSAIEMYLEQKKLNADGRA